MQHWAFYHLILYFVTWRLQKRGSIELFFKFECKDNTFFSQMQILSRKSCILSRNTHKEERRKTAPLS